jgi:hypothetical protein
LRFVVLRPSYVAGTLDEEGGGAWQWERRRRKKMKMVCCWLRGWPLTAECRLLSFELYV